MHSRHSPSPRLFWLLCSLLLMGATVRPGLCARAQTPVALPETPAGKQLAAFLAAFNTGSRATLKAYLEANMDGPPNDPGFYDSLTDQDQILFAQSHGFTVRKITQSGDAVVKAQAQANSTGAWMELTLYVTAQAPEYVKAVPPFHIVGVGVGDIETPLEAVSRQRLSEAQIRAKVRTLMSALVASDAFSGVVCVAKQGKPIFAQAYGLASRAWNSPNRLDTRFNLASITKMFTAVAVGQLMEQGKLAASDTVGKILPDYPNKEVAQQVTLHQLLSHTSGLIGGRAQVEKTTESPTLRTIHEMLPSFVKEPLSFRPGQQFDYSNAGFILLGAIIEKASGQSYYDYMREHIFKPAGMDHTDFYELDTDPQNLATGFMDGPHGTRLDNIFKLSVKGNPAGGCYSTCDDMTRFQMALVHHILLKETSLQTLWTGVTEQPERNAEYGYGAQIERYNGVRIVWHGGGWQGITNQFDMYPELGYTVVILSNYDDDPAAIANRIREWLTQGVSNAPAQPELPPSLALTATLSSPTVTRGNPISITITVQNSGGTAHASVINMEVKDANGEKANQQFTMDQKIGAEQTRTYTYSWTPMLPGRYTLDIGAFGPGWSRKLRFESGIATITVN